MEDSVSQKTCTRCKQVKDVQEFYINRGVPRSRCIKCTLEVKREQTKRLKDGFVSNYSDKVRSRKELFQQGLIQCPNCEETKPFSDFYTNPSRGNGHSSYCKKCCSITDARKHHRESTVERFLLSPPETKMCYTCLQTKPIDEFHLRRKNDPVGGRVSDCKDCQKARQRRNYHRSNDKKKHLIVLRSHNITEEQYKVMFDAQGGVCAICKQEETAKDPRSGLVRKLSIDHCHQTGLIRELLCSRCNMMIGMARDNPEALINAAEYLKKHLM